MNPPNDALSVLSKEQRELIERWEAERGICPGSDLETAVSLIRELCGRVEFHQEQAPKWMAIEAERNELAAKAARIATDFKRHLDVMGEINSHLGYKFSQPLIIAREALARTIGSYRLAGTAPKEGEKP